MLRNYKELRNIRAELTKYDITIRSIANELYMTSQNVSIVLRGKSQNEAVIALCKEKIQEAKDAERIDKKRA